MTCKDCRKYNNCLESSRMYPCTVFARKDEQHGKKVKPRRSREADRMFRSLRKD